MSTTISTLEMFSIGVGPSSSHTVGPMRAATAFVTDLRDRGVLSSVAGVRVELCGSLGATGVGHRTPDAVVAGLRGHDPQTCDPAVVPSGWTGLGDCSEVRLLGDHPVTMAEADLRLAPLTRLPGHPNGMRFTAVDSAGVVVAEQVAYSVGGGFVVTEEELREADTLATTPTSREVPHPYSSAADLLSRCQEENLTIAGLVWANEVAWHGAEQAAEGIDAIWEAMSACVDAGLAGEGLLPGSLRVRRRARDQRAKLERLDECGEDTTVEWLQAYAMAVNEENAAGGRVVTAPTNGAAGIVPAVGRHFLRIRPDIDRDPARRRAAMRTYLLTAAAIGTLYKLNASISGAEAGCQGEVGSACSMAAGAFCALLGGTPEQVENAAEIAMEHHLGLTCDPVGGLVQVPCIERNAVAACTAVAAARLARQGDGAHVVSLDAVIETMRQTGLDMSSKYKETSTGGLAVNVIEC